MHSKPQSCHGNSRKPQILFWKSSAKLSVLRVSDFTKLLRILRIKKKIETDHENPNALKTVLITRNFIWLIWPFSSTQTPSVQHIGSTQWPNVFSPKTPQFHTSLSSTIPSVQHPKSLSLTPKTPQFHTLSARRGFRCWTEGFLVLNWGIFAAEKEWPFCVKSMCWTEGVCVELRGSVWNWGVLAYIHEFRNLFFSNLI